MRIKCKKIYGRVEIPPMYKKGKDEFFLLQEMYIKNKV